VLTAFALSVTVVTIGASAVVMVERIRRPHRLLLKLPQNHRAGGSCGDQAMRIGVTANVGGDPERGSGIQSFASWPCYPTSSLAVRVMQNSLVPHVPKRAIAARRSPNILKHNMITKTATFFMDS
jgi:hypothetical protein